MAVPQLIPLSSVPSQSISVTLGTQTCRLDLTAKRVQVPTQPPGSIVTDPPVFVAINPVFLDLYINDVLKVAGALCHNGVRLIRDVYHGFVGDLSFVDLQGSDDPVFFGLGSRFILIYWPDL